MLPITSATTSYTDSKYRLSAMKGAWRRRRIGLYMTVVSIMVFLIHAWRQSHARPADRSEGGRLVSYEDEIRALKEALNNVKAIKSEKQLVPYDPRLGSAREPREMIDPEDELFDKMVVFDNYVPPSIVACTGRNATERVCRIKNFCFDPTRNIFFILKNGATIVQNGKNPGESRLVDGTSIDGHNRFFIDYVESDPAILLNRPVHWVDRVTYVMARFHRLNIMHTLHDDFMGIFHMAKLYGPANREDPTAPFSLDTNVFFSDWYGRDNYDYLYRMISQNPLQYRSEWRKATSHPVCFAEAIVGNSKHSTWYNYGFLEPQAPIAHKKVSGLHVRDGARYIMRRLGIAGWYQHVIARIHQQLLQDVVLRQHGEERQYNTGSPFDKQHYITIFIRQRDRLILNLHELGEALQQTYGLPVRHVRMEDQTLTDQIIVMRSTMIAVGMHGSALILGMFLPPGAVLVEMFPFAVPPENYTPYKTMSQLDGMRIIYRSWQNRHSENNRPHPERQPELGGLKHLAEDERQRIAALETVPPHLCCRDPTWLYRIYQDTVVHISELVAIIDSGIMEAANFSSVPDSAYYTLAPAAPDQVECDASPRLPLGSKEASEAPSNPLDLTVRWSRPWNGVATEKYGVWVHQHYTEFFAHNGTTQMVLEECSPGSVYDIWVRGYSAHDVPGMYTEHFQCSCAIGAAAQKVEKSVQK